MSDSEHNKKEKTATALQYEGKKAPTVTAKAMASWQKI